MGPSGLSSIGANCYAQNVYDLQEYFKTINNKTFPVFRGYTLDQDLIIRRELINSIINYSCLEFKDIEEKFNIDFKEYFGGELSSLNGMVDDGLIELSESHLKATPVGKLFVRHICMVFDRFLQIGKSHKPTSKRDNRLVASA